ncbi:MAG: hypothetical protein QT04_C0050G0017 [archaeon GW2011_AR11]|nr:MAG: hypothetical protein QT04_C0050G0017 [archaeon GW2011_AR11]
MVGFTSIKFFYIFFDFLLRERIAMEQNYPNKVGN